MAETLQPGTAEELREIVAAALAEKRPLEIRGRGTKVGLGRPVEADLVVALESMSGIELYEPEELVMIAGAGTPVAEIERLLADNQQQLAFEPADYGRILGGDAGQGTIGGVFACNLSGPRRLKAGAARDHFLGVTAVTGRGDVIKSGGRVMKNVTGYDLCKLFAGSYGTLAAMTRVSFKVLPASEATATLIIAGLDLEGGMAALRQAVASPYEVAGAAYLPAAAATRSGIRTVSGAGHDLALVRLEGTAPSVQYRLDVLRELLARGGAEVAALEQAESLSLWHELRDVRPIAPERMLWRLSVPPAAATEIVRALAAEVASDWFADWAGGLLWLGVPEGEDARAGAVRAALAGAGGHATLVRAPAGVRAAVPPFEPEPGPLAALSARVKHSFDPERILNRGRMFEDV